MEMEAGARKALEALVAPGLTSPVCADTCEHAGSRAHCTAGVLPAGLRPQPAGRARTSKALRGKDARESADGVCLPDWKADAFRGAGSPESSVWKGRNKISQMRSREEQAFLQNSISKLYCLLRGGSCLWKMSECSWPGRTVLGVNGPEVGHSVASRTGAQWAAEGEPWLQPQTSTHSLVLQTLPAPRPWDTVPP